MGNLRRVVMVFVLVLCTGCGGLFSKDLLVAMDPYCPQEEHLAPGDRLDTGRFLFWNSLRAERGSNADWKLKEIGFDSWNGVVYGVAEIGHQECFRFETVRDSSGVKAVDIFLKSLPEPRGGQACDRTWIDEDYVEGVRIGELCGEGHTGGWRAYQ